MNTRLRPEYVKLGWLPIALLCWSASGNAQVPVDASGVPLGDYEQSSDFSTNALEEIPLLSAAELQELVGPVALYPDDLLAVVLAASAYPLQIVQAGRFLDDLKVDSSLQPDDSWDDSVVALTNYPEAVELMNDDLDWTWRLGEAVVAQQSDVIAAVEVFRDRAYAAGNLKTDDYQTITQIDGIIEITPIEDDVIYVPYYEPESVLVYQTRPVYHYYAHAYPVYYYPYQFGHTFRHDFFWGVTTAFSLGWHTNSLHVYHHSYYGHPYYGHSYWDHWWYRSPSINVYNNHYGHHYSGHHYNGHHDYDRYSGGDYWHPQTRRTVSAHDQRVTRTRYYPSSNTQANLGTTSVGRTSYTSRTGSSQATQRRNTYNDARTGNDPRTTIEFRDRPTTIRPTSVARTGGNERHSSGNRLATEKRTTTSGRRSQDQGSRTTQSPPRTTTSHSTNRSSSGQLESARPSKRPSSSATTVRRQSSPRPQTVARQSYSPQSAPSRSQPRQSAPSRSQPRQSAPSRSQPSQSAPSQSQSHRSESSKSSNSSGNSRGSHSSGSRRKN